MTKTVTYDETKWKLVPVEPTEEMANSGWSLKPFVIDIYSAMIASAPEHPENDEWLPIETAPRNTSVLTYRKPNADKTKRSIRCGTVQVAIKYDGWATWSENWPSYYQPTHWQPLPEPPKGE